MDPTVESALIGAAAAVVGVGGTVIVAVLGFRTTRAANENTRAANDAALAATREANKEALAATREGQLADRYTKAIDQLGSTIVDVTIGGIYALERIARDSPEGYHQTVMEVLAACIRENSAKPLQEPAPVADIPGLVPDPEPPIRPDIQAAMTVIARRDTERDLRQINLRRVYLPHADLPEAHLSGADLSGAILRRANLTGADLSGADLTGADLSGAILIRADLSGAILLRADLHEADPRDADLRGAVLRLADLRSANFSGADLRGARWTEHMPVPEGWERARTGLLQRAATGSNPAEPD